MSVALNGWHPGERAFRARLGPGFTLGSMAMAYTTIEASMPEQHRVFYARNVPFLPLTTRDARGRPWASLVSGAARPGDKEKGPGFVRSPSETELEMELEMWEGDPMLGNLELCEGEGKDGGRMLVAGLGIEFSTRRRNKFAGWIERVDKTGPRSRRVYLRVNQAIGNCPKYINVRTLDSYPDASPEIVFRRLDMAPEERLPSEIIEFVLRADTVFLGTSYEADAASKERYPSHVGMNARGGRPGFVRVRPSDGRTLVLPDYSGNRLMTSLGNVEATSLAAMTFLDFATGDILYLTGVAKNLVGADAQALMPRQNVLTTLYVEAYIFVRDALPVRQRPNTDVAHSPYSPPIKFLAEEKEGRPTRLLDDVFATLARVDILSPTLATFTFETDKPVRIRPGQAAALDFTDVLGAPRYAHMAPGHEASVNDDHVRTWTVSSSSTEGVDTKAFSLTVREKPGGLVTGALFALARHAAAKMPSVLADARGLGLRVRLVGITGAFTLPLEVGDGRGSLKMLWIAGGIGVTPFLSMLSSISSSSTKTKAGHDINIILILSTREPHILLRLIHDALAQDQAQAQAQATRPEFKLTLHIFTSSDLELDEVVDLGSSAVVVQHQGRPRFSNEEEESLVSLASDVKERLVYLCGPPEFEESAMDALARAGVDRAAVMREGFGY